MKPILACILKFTKEITILFKKYKLLLRENQINWIEKIELEFKIKNRSFFQRRMSDILQ